MIAESMVAATTVDDGALQLDIPKTFVIDYLDQNFETRQMTCEAPSREIAMSVFRQAFSRFVLKRIRRASC